MFSKKFPKCPWCDRRGYDIETGIACCAETERDQQEENWLNYEAGQKNPEVLS